MISNPPGDKPDDVLDNLDRTHVSIQNLYLTTCIYRAPGSGSEFVPLLTLGWTWIAAADLKPMRPRPGQPTWQWSGGVAVNPNVHFRYDLPSVTWQNAYLNSQTHVKP